MLGIVVQREAVAGFRWPTPQPRGRDRMTARSVSNPRAATHEEAARCLFAIELSKRS